MKISAFCYILANIGNAIFETEVVAMCTTIAMNRGKLYFGRNMDLEYDFGQRIVIVPRRFPLRKSVGGVSGEHYAFVGMAAVSEGYPLFADGMNEYGLCAAALNFPQYSVYTAQGGISPYELIALVLSECQSVAEAKKLIADRGLNSIPFSGDVPLTPLHWHIADSIGSIVVECTAEGLVIHENNVGVLTNSPSFLYHLNNLSRCLNVTSSFPDSRFSDSIALFPTGGGFGGIGLPGDYSSESRFVRAAFLLHNCAYTVGEVAQCFHILGAVEMPEGSVVTADGRLQRTRYSCCMDTNEGVYFYSTYQNRSLSAVRLSEAQADGDVLIEYPLENTQRITRINY